MSINTFRRRYRYSVRKNGEIKRFLDTNRPYRDDGLRNEARRQARLFDRTRKIAKLNIYNTRGYITKTERDCVRVGLPIKHWWGQ